MKLYAKVLSIGIGLVFVSWVLHLIPENDYDMWYGMWSLSTSLGGFTSLIIGAIIWFNEEN